MLFRESFCLFISSRFKCFTVKRTLTTNNLSYGNTHVKFLPLRKNDFTTKFNNLSTNHKNNCHLIVNGLCKSFSLSAVTSHHSKRFVKFNTSTPLVSTYGVICNQERNKSTKKGQKRPEYDSDSDSDQEEENIQGTKTVTSRMQSLRLDGLLKKSLNITRNKAESAFYEGKIRVNGKKPDKKSFQCKIGDEVDLIKGLSPLNSEFINVSRIEILSVNETTEEDLMVKVRRTKSLLIENYKDHPWKKEASSG